MEFAQIFTAPSCPSTPFAVSAGSGPAVTACSGAAVAGVTGSVRGAAVGTGGAEVGTALVLDLGDVENPRVLAMETTESHGFSMVFTWFKPDMPRKDGMKLVFTSSLDFWKSVMSTLKQKASGLGTWSLCSGQMMLCPESTPTARVGSQPWPVTLWETKLSKHQIRNTIHFEIKTWEVFIANLDYCRVFTYNMWQSPYFSVTTRRTSNSTEATGASLVLSLGLRWTSEFGGPIPLGGTSESMGGTVLGGIPSRLGGEYQSIWQGVLICAPDCCNVSDDQKQIQLALNALDMAHLSNVKWPIYYYCYM